MREDRLSNNDVKVLLAVGLLIVVVLVGLTTGNIMNNKAHPVVPVAIATCPTPVPVVQSPIPIAPATLERGYHLVILKEGVDQTQRYAIAYCGWDAKCTYLGYRFNTNELGLKEAEKEYNYFAHPELHKEPDPVISAVVH